MKANYTTNIGIMVLSFALLSFCIPTPAQAGGRVAAWGDNAASQCILPNGMENVKEIAGGGGHSLAVKSDGTVVAWGRNDFSQAAVPQGLSNVVAISAGGFHSLALQVDGTVIAWGYNYYGQSNVPDDLSHVKGIAAGRMYSMALKADGTVAVWGSLDSSSEFSLPPGISNVIAVAAGGFHCMALKADGTVAAWGSNLYGQTKVPPGLSNVVAIAAGSRHSLALTADGGVLAWGTGSSGQTNTPPGLSNVVAIAAGESISLALKTDGTVVDWGAYTYGDTPIPAGMSNVTAIACGTEHNLALVSEGPPHILNQSGNIGVSYQSDVVLSVTAIGFESLSYRWCFNGGILYSSDRISGINTASLTISNAQFADMGRYTIVVSNAFGSVQSSGAVLTVISPPIITQQPTGCTVIAGTNITLIAAATGTPPLNYQWLFEGDFIAGATRTSLSLSNVQSSQSGNYSLRVTNVYGIAESSNALIAVLESAPYILSQPTNRSGFLGGTATFAVNARGSTPLSYQWRFNGADLPEETNAVLTLTALRYDQAGLYTVAISNLIGTVVSAKAQLSVNQVAVWGGNSGWFGNSLTNVPSGLTNLIAISAGDDHLLALKADGTVAAWGGSIVTRLPGAVDPLTNVPAGLNGVVAIAAGSSHNLAVKSNGTVVAWGDNTYGLTNVPAGLSNVISVAAGEVHSLALKSDGKVVAWGSRSTLLPSSYYAALTNVPAGLSNVVAIAAGSDRSLGLRSDGRVVAWGLTGATTVPANLSNVIAIACGEVVSSLRPAPGSSSSFNLALRADGTVVSWIAGTSSNPGTYPWILPPTPPTGLSNVVAIAAGGHGMALKADGSVVMWGLTNPPPPQGLSNIFAVAAGYGFAAALTGDGSPRFTIQPISQTVTNGAKVQLHARAVGVPPLSYQWQLDGVALPGATSADLTITSARGRDTGSYRMLVTNALGTATSSPAKLNIPFSTNLAVALNATDLVWTNSTPGAPWFAQIQETHDDEAAAQSGHITHGQQSELQTTVIGPGTLTFWWKVSSEEGYDRLWFNVDVMSSIRAISGETDWQQRSMPIPTGAHVVRWVYSKDATVSAGQDAGWVDEVVFTPSTPLALSAPRLLPDGSLVFEASDPAGRTLLPANLALIEVQASINLRDWVTLPNACTLTNGALRLRDPEYRDHPNRFYRTVER